MQLISMANHTDKWVGAEYPLQAIEVQSRGQIASCRQRVINRHASTEADIPQPEEPTLGHV